MNDHPTSEGNIPFDVPGAEKSVSTWYKVIGNLSNSQSALIILHGGPGAGHEYLLPFTDIFNLTGIPVVFYDQIGTGKSTHFREKMNDTKFWTTDLFIRELENLIDHLGLRKSGFFLLGQAWGGQLAGSYAVRRPEGLKKVVIASGAGDMSQYIKGMDSSIAQLPEETRKTIEDCEGKGDYESPEFQAASMVWGQRHFCRLDPWPQALLQALGNCKDDPTTYLTMHGPCEYRPSGSLKDWEGASEAHRINVPVLLTNGRYDEVQDASMKPWFDRIEKVKWVTFADSSHFAHLEERERYMEVVASFLT